MWVGKDQSHFLDPRAFFSSGFHLRLCLDTPLKTATASSWDLEMSLSRFWGLGFQHGNTHCRYELWDLPSHFSALWIAASILTFQTHQLAHHQSPNLFLDPLHPSLAQSVTASRLPEHPWAVVYARTSVVLEPPKTLRRYIVYVHGLVYGSTCRTWFSNVPIHGISSLTILCVGY